MKALSRIPQYKFNKCAIANAKYSLNLGTEGKGRKKEREKKTKKRIYNGEEVKKKRG